MAELNELKLKSHIDQINIYCQKHAEVAHELSHQIQDQDRRQ